MIVLDTNILSELTKKIVDKNVIQWIESYPPSQLFTTAITKAEIETGVALMPEGKRKKTILNAVDKIFQLFEDRILPFDHSVTSSFATIRLQRKLSGTPISFADAQIAAIALHHHFTLATRNTKDFRQIENLMVVNPWTATDQK